MTAFVRALSQKSAKERDEEAFNLVMTFSGAGLLVSLLYLISGIDVASGLLF
jgi:putative copper export protein